MKINLGCGWRNFGSEWVHIDAGDYSHLDFNCNIKDGVPLSDNSADLIYASHIIAYFDREEIVNILKEWRRVLKPGGTLRLATPDFSVLTDLYKNGRLPLSGLLGPVYGKMKMGTETIYHKTAYDFISLKEVLNECGFINVKLYDWRETEHSNFDDHSQAYVPHMDKENGTLVSLNIECNK